ncbi:MAG: hypothetical protein WD876_02640 [Candidatus Pacearchaeota archaeon]
MGETNHVRRIADYFKKNIKKGYTSESLKWALIKQGYQKFSVEKAIELANQEMAHEAPILQDKPVITHEVIDETGQMVEVKKSWWKRLFGL